VSLSARIGQRTRGLRRFAREYRRDRAGMVGLIILIGFVLLAVGAPLLFGAPPTLGSADGALLDASWKYPLGTDEVARDVLPLVVYGSRISLIVGFLATLISILIGTLVGIVAGYNGGRIDTVLMRATDFFLVTPALVLAILVASIAGPSLINVIAIIGFTSWPATARVIRAQTLSVKERAFVARSRAYGARAPHVIRRHILPNVWPMIMASSTLTVATAIFLETTLAFLGLADPTATSWGTMMHRAFVAGAAGLGKWGYVFAPGIAVSMVILAFTFMGRAFERILNPRLQRRHNDGPIVESVAQAVVVP
jgi:peptide/nickel transport system permease protein